MPETPVRQVSVSELLKGVTTSPLKLLVAATVFYILALALPVALIRSNIGLGGPQSGGISGATVGGWPVWIALLGYVAAIASYFVEPLQPFRKVLALVALVLTALVVIWAYFYGPFFAGIAEMTRAMGALGGNASLSQLVSIYPHIGIVALILAVACLVMAVRRTA